MYKSYMPFALYSATAFGRLRRNGGVSAHMRSLLRSGIVTAISSVKRASGRFGLLFAVSASNQGSNYLLRPIGDVRPWNLRSALAGSALPFAEEHDARVWR